jgi:hypothetical protein
LARSNARTDQARANVPEVWKTAAARAGTDEMTSSAKVCLRRIGVPASVIKRHPPMRWSWLTGCDATTAMTVRLQLPMADRHVRSVTFRQALQVLAGWI